MKKLLKAVDLTRAGISQRHIPAIEKNKIITEDGKIRFSPNLENILSELELSSEPILETDELLHYISDIQAITSYGKYWRKYGNYWKIKTLKSYPYLCVQCKSKNKLLHKMVYETFVGPIPKGLWVRHLDDDRTNNHIDNLTLGTPKDNQDDCVINNISTSSWKLQDHLEDILYDHYRDGHSYTTISKKYDCSSVTICHICRGKTWVDDILYLAEKSSDLRYFMENPKNATMLPYPFDRTGTANYSYYKDKEKVKKPADFITGIIYRENKFDTQLRRGKNIIYLGRYDTELDAALAIYHYHIGEEKHLKVERVKAKILEKYPDADI